MLEEVFKNLNKVQRTLHQIILWRLMTHHRVATRRLWSKCNQHDSTSIRFRITRVNHNAVLCIFGINTKMPCTPIQRLLTIHRAYNNIPATQKDLIYASKIKYSSPVASNVFIIILFPYYHLFFVRPTIILHCSLPLLQTTLLCVPSPPLMTKPYSSPHQSTATATSTAAIRYTTTATIQFLTLYIIHCRQQNSMLGPLALLLSPQAYSSLTSLLFS